MKVWKLLSPKVIAEEERPDSIASPTQAKVKIAKVLIAYPEIRAYTGAAGIRYPRVPGMYAIGVVVEAGEGCVKVEKNTRVFLDGVAPCGECAECKKVITTAAFLRRSRASTRTGSCATLSSPKRLIFPPFPLP